MLCQRLRRSIKVLIRHCGMNTKKSVPSEALEALFSPPSSVRGSKILNREDFRRDVPLPAIRLRDASLCSRFMQRLPHALLRFSTIKRVVDDVGEDGKVNKLILLLPEELRDKPLSKEDHEWISSNGGEETTHTVALGYNHFSTHDTLRALLPLEVEEVPTGYETVGHIAHFNLRKECLPYKEIIGQVTLDKHRHIRTIVNKTDQIDDTFRFFKMEVLAGDNDMITTVKENGCTFSFDFSKVYWNSRLHSEHERLVDEIKKKDIVLDVFAGVGPFSLPAAKRGCTVYANDLNPHSYEALCANAKKNGVAGKLKAYNLDGREFIRKITHELLVEPSKELNTFTKHSTHVIMNLPATAIQFLDSFRGLFSCVPFEHRSSIQLPTVYCYCFSKSEDAPEVDSLQMVQRSLGVSALRAGTYSTYTVRRVAPNKVMMKVTFRLPPEVAFFENSHEAGSPLPNDKRDEGTCTHTSDVGECTRISEVEQDCQDVGRITGVDKEEVTATTTDLEDHPSTKRRRLE